MEKMTKKEIYNLIAEKNADVEVIVDFCNAEIARLDAKAEKAKAKAAEKKAAGDELYGVIVSCLTADLQTAEDILAQLEGDELTVAKVRARLSQAVKNGVARKESVKVEGKAKVHYAIAE